MADPTPNNDWRTAQFRQKVVAQIEEAMRNAGTTTTKSSLDMEKHMHAKANTRDEYLAYAARIILHMTNAKKAGGAGVPVQGGAGPGMGGAGQMGGPQGLTDPINALTTLTAGGTMPQQQPRPQGQPGQPGMGPGPMGMQAQRGPFVSYQQGVMQRPPPPHPHMQQMQQQSMQQPMQQQMQGARGMDFMQQQHHAGMQQQQHPGMQQYGGGYSSQQQPGQVQQATSSQAPPVSSQQQPQQQTYHVPSPMGGGQPQPSPLGLPQPSPGSLMPQQSPMGPSPLSNSMMGAPSPGQMHTPGNPYAGGSMTSPAGPGGQLRSDDPEEKRYRAKLMELQKYIEPLKRMIRRIENDDDRKKDQIKMKNLLDILLDTKRMQFPALLKCEEVLKKLTPEFQRYPSGVPTSSTTPTTSTVSSLPKTGGPMCQALLNTVATHMKSPVINHTLHRTFGPAMLAIHGPPLRSSSPPPKRARRFSPSPGSEKIPWVLQGEIARSIQSFSIDLDPLHQGSTTIQLVCKINNNLLPSVPPITVSIPENYPKESPTWEPQPHDYESTPFLQRVEKNFSNMILQLPDRFSLTALLNMWEMSIRKACAPPSSSSASL